MGSDDPGELREEIARLRDELARLRSTLGPGGGEAEERLRESEARYRLLFENMTTGFALHEILCDDEGRPVDYRYLEVNPAFEKLTGLPASAVLGKSVREALPNLEPYWIETFGRVALTGEPIAYENYVRELDRYYDTWAFSPKRGQFAVVFHDVTERKRLEEDLRQAQKMEGIGRLAGGIAHDFNNLLTAILGYTELAATQVPDNGPVADYLDNVRKAGEHAANLTSQLLAFARRQVLAPKVISLNGAIDETRSLLGRLIGEDIAVNFLPGPDLWHVKVDPGQIEQILINLAVNARDAMAGGGTLTLETRNVTLDRDYSRIHPDVVPGDYVLLAVSDTGVGMDTALQRHVFEPFFTTKEPGKGTGLGLATCHGIVKQSGGHIWLYSEPGHGTTFKIYLPRAEGAVEERVGRVERAAPSGVETILLVEDEPLVRGVAVDALRSHGYRVIEAPTGLEALALARTCAGPVDLMVTDVVMPGISGPELAKRLLAERPEVKVLYVSGYSGNAIVHRGVLDPGVAYLQKPYSPAVLARRVREVLDGEA